MYPGSFEPAPLLTGNLTQPIEISMLALKRCPPRCLMILALLLSLLANAVLFAELKKYYTLLLNRSVFPDHQTIFHQANAALGAKQARRILLFGDSRIDQWKNFPIPPGYRLINRGISGETTAQARTRFDADVLALKPDIVVLQLGINDLTAIGVLPHRQADIVQQCRANLEYFVNALLQRGDIEVIFFTIIPADRPPLLRRLVWSEAINQQTKAINQHWLQRPPIPHLHVIDSRGALQAASGDWHDRIFADTVHLSPAGYGHLNSAISSVLKKL